MRRLISLTGLALVAAMLPMHGAGAEPRVGPPLHIQLYLAVYLNEDGSEDRSAHLAVSGTQCLPENAPASVIVTLDRKPGEVFTATPNANGRWSLNISIDVPLDGAYVVNAECDNYFGSTIYPTATTTADDAIMYGIAAASSHRDPTATRTTVSDTSADIANTGTRSANELVIGLSAILLGALLVVAGRPQRRSH